MSFYNLTMRGSAVFIWSDRALFVGDRSVTAMHSHHAVELALSLDERGVDLASATGSLEAAPGALVRSNAPHRLSIPGPKVAMLYVDAFSTVGRQLEHRLREVSLAALDRELVDSLRSGLASLLDEQAGVVEARRITDAAIDGLLAGEEPLIGRPDPRVTRALALIDARLDAPPSLAEVSGAVGLSSSRLSHLFKAQVGLPMRRYVLWMRLRAALTEAMEGGDMARAAHAAGFSDAAHFTRTCRRMFGLPPTAFAPVDAVFVAPTR